MIRANFISQKGAWQATPADTIVLDYEGRHRRRVTMTGTRGVEFLLDLPEAVALRGGDALILEDGRLVEIIAAPEDLAEVRCADPRQLARVAYHIGNRHVQAEILANRIRIRRDHVLEDMVRGLGAKVAHIEAPFEPDTGAYEPQEAHAHSHAAHAHKGHDHKHHDHDHGHDHKHAAPLTARRATCTTSIAATTTRTTTRRMITSTSRTIMRTRTRTRTPMAPMPTSTTEPALALFAWLSPSYPVGAFAYSHGVEWAVECGDVRDAASLAQWIETILAHGSGRNDAVLFTAAFNAVKAGRRSRGHRRTRLRARRLERAASRIRAAGRGLPRRHARRMAVRCARRGERRHRREHGLSRLLRCRRRRARHGASPCA